MDITDLKIMLLLLLVSDYTNNVETCVLRKNIFLTSNSFSPSYPQAQEQAASAYSANYRGDKVYINLQSTGFDTPVELRSGQS